MIGSVFGVDRDRPGDQVNNRAMALLLERDHPEQMQAFGMPGINRKDLLADSFGFAQAASLMVPEGCGKHPMCRL